MSRSYSPLAWELAHYGKHYATKDGPMVQLTMCVLGETVVGRGHTSTEAMQALAVELDRWAERVSVGQGQNWPEVLTR